MPWVVRDYVVPQFIGILGDNIMSFTNQLVSIRSEYHTVILGLTGNYPRVLEAKILS